MQRLEEHYKDMQDIEFTVEDGKLYLLQTRSAKRTAAAALKAAVDMVDEGLISREEAVARIDPGQLDQLLHPRIDPSADYDVVAKGLNASPGAASGGIVFDADTAEERGKNGDAVILVRWETTPDDIHGMIAAQGILTAHGGMTSHAAVVARGMGKPCVAGCEALSVDADAKTASLNGHKLGEGDVITIDGGTGEVIVGEVPLVPPDINEDFETVLGWADELRRLKVRANADTPEDAAKAREFGAEGIGLCRTEHMFMADDRLPVVREMIMASDEEERRAALDKLLPHQQSDFEGIFEAMAGLPVTIRLLDPPLHEFLPPLEEAKDDRMRSRIRALQEANPMLGTRGCRLGLQFPEIYEMQVRAIIRAAAAVQERTGDAPLVEIMHPLVGFQEELRRLRELTIETASEEGDVEYLVGTMIELPRACVRADEIAEEADFFSFGTNDLTQTALGFSRDDAEGKFLTFYLQDGILERNPFETLDQSGVGDLMRVAVERGRRTKPGPEAGDLRRARRRAALGRLLPPARARLRLLLAVPRAARAAGRRPGGARGERHRGRLRRRVIRPPHPDEGERLREIAIAAKAHWGYDLDQVRAWAGEADFTTGKEVLVAEQDGRAVGFASVIPQGEVCVLDDLWIEPDAMGAGLGRELFVAAADAGESGRRPPARVGGRAERGGLLRADGRPLPARQRAQRVGPNPARDGRRALEALALGGGSRWGDPLEEVEARHERPDEEEQEREDAVGAGRPEGVVVCPPSRRRRRRSGSGSAGCPAQPTAAGRKPVRSTPRETANTNAAAGMPGERVGEAPEVVEPARDALVEHGVGTCGHGRPADHPADEDGVGGRAGAERDRVEARRGIRLRAPHRAGERPEEPEEEDRGEAEEEHLEAELLRVALVEGEEALVRRRRARRIRDEEEADHGEQDVRNARRSRPPLEVPPHEGDSYSPLWTRQYAIATEITPIPISPSTPARPGRP